jgi:hypothetical protein
MLVCKHIITQFFIDSNCRETGQFRCNALNRQRFVAHYRFVGGKVSESVTKPQPPEPAASEKYFVSLSGSPSRSS